MQHSQSLPIVMPDAHIVSKDQMFVASTFDQLMVVRLTIPGNLPRAEAGDSYEFSLGVGVYRYYVRQRNNYNFIRVLVPKSWKDAYEMTWGSVAYLPATALRWEESWHWSRKLKRLLDAGVDESTPLGLNCAQACAHTRRSKSLQLKGVDGCNRPHFLRVIDGKGKERLLSDTKAMSHCPRIEVSCPSCSQTHSRKVRTRLLIDSAMIAKLISQQMSASSSASRVRKTTKMLKEEALRPYLQGGGGGASSSNATLSMDSDDEPEFQKEVSREERDQIGYATAIVLSDSDDEQAPTEKASSSSSISVNDAIKMLADNFLENEEESQEPPPQSNAVPLSVPDPTPDNAPPPVPPSVPDPTPDDTPPPVPPSVPDPTPDNALPPAPPSVPGPAQDAPLTTSENDTLNHRPTTRSMRKVVLRLQGV